MAVNSSTFNSNISFLSKLILFLAIVATMDACVGFALRSLYFSQKSGLDFRTTYSLEQTQAQVIILGNSRANHHYDPRLISDKLSLSCYNAGRDGQGMLYMYAVERALLKRYTPRIIVADVDPSMLMANPKKYSSLWSLLPYYKTHPEIRPIVEKRSKFEKLKLISSIYPFNSMAFTILKYNFAIEEDYKGYIPLQSDSDSFRSASSHLNPFEAIADRPAIDDTAVEIFKAMISDAKAAGVLLYMVISPTYASSRMTDDIELLKHTLNVYDVPLLDYSRDVTFAHDAGLYRDTIHLNHIGAELFSHIVASRIGLDISQKHNIVNYSHPSFRLISQ